MIEVAAAIIINASGEILLAKRPLHKDWGGYWELPGGKINPGETAAEALFRELKEELNINIEKAEFLLKKDFTQESNLIRISFYKVFIENAERPAPTEHTELLWIKTNEDLPQQIIPADFEILAEILNN